ncbi:S8 family peptidase [Halovivax gelatinilyticus]|uniref:S8 family peptidase n=1 Tax=Halovivax gelatinilyticus TaxID=2961597 RepID=UPI0020CA7CA2|nr:S8 family peptidase [Halovivax gelatinilyticus]
MTLSRRRLLQGVGAGVAAGVLGSSASATDSRRESAATEAERVSAATDTKRVFVHPRNGLLGDLLDVVEQLGGTTVLEYDSFDFVVAEVPSNRLDDLLAAPSVASVEEDGGLGIPDDWSPSLLDFLDPGGSSDCSRHPDQRASWGVERIGADDVEPDGSGVSVGILDTGIQTDHCSLSVAGGENFTRSGPSSDYEDRHGHGTHVAGIAGADDNDVGVVGVAPAADLYAVKVLDDDGDGRYSTLIAGIDWCLSNDVEVISMSLGGDQESETVDEAIATAHEAGHLLLCSAGNEGNRGDGTCNEETMTYPATHESVVAVAAMDEDDTLASYSSVGSAIDLLGPGTDVNSATAGNRYAEASGTSMACPYVTGVAALLWETRDEDGPGPNEAVRSILAETAEPVLDTCEEGHGLVDARAALGDDRAGDGDESRTGGNTPSGPGGIVDHFISAVEWIATVVRRLFEWLSSLFK